MVPFSGFTIVLIRRTRCAWSADEGEGYSIVAFFFWRRFARLPTAHLILLIWMDTTKLVEVLLERKSDGHAHLHNLTWSPSLVPCEIRFGIEVE
jgi:hypothetical protein